MPNKTSSPNSPASRRTRRQTPEIELLQAILDRLGSPQWDLLIVGDGSGSGWDKACGWAGILLDNQTRKRKLFYGAMSAGSVNSAESMPYLQALSWFDATQGKKRLRSQGLLRVHILTDSQVIASWGARAMAPDGGEVPRSNVAYWAAMREFRRLGYHCHFHWARRSTTQLNWVADLIAGMARRELQRAFAVVDSAPDIAAKALRAIQTVQFADPTTGEEINLYHLNPHKDQSNDNAIYYAAGHRAAD